MSYNESGCDNDSSSPGTTAETSAVPVGNLSVYLVPGIYEVDLITNHNLVHSSYRPDTPRNEDRPANPLQTQRNSVTFGNIFFSSTYAVEAAGAPRVSERGCPDLGPDPG